MTVYVFDGTAKTFQVPLSPPADMGSVTWSLRDQTGTLMTGATAVPIPTPDGAQSVNVTVSAALNTKTTIAETRFLIVDWTEQDATQEVILPYVLTAWMPIRTQPSDVMSALGVNIAELVASEIDIPSAALLVQDDIGPGIFQAALVSGDTQTIQLNQLIALRCAIELLPSIPLRIAQVQKTDSASFQRFSKFDPEKHFKYMWDAYTRVRDNLTAGLLPTTNPIALIPSTRPASPFLKPQQLYGPYWAPSPVIPYF